MNFKAQANFTGLNVATALRTYQTANRLSVEQSAEIVLEESEAIVAVDTGALRESGHVEIEVAGPTATGFVVYDTEYAAMVEYGTGERGAASPGAGEGPYTPGWPGQVAQPYLRPALDTARPAIVEVFKDNYSAATKLLGK